MLTHVPWAAIPGLHHGFLERPECGLARDWSGALAAVGVSLPAVTVRQVHGARVVQAPIVDRSPEADAIVTAGSGFVVGVVTADCAPVLLAAPAHRAVAAVHAGWRGAAAGVIESAVAQLRDVLRIDPREVEAAVGPAIGPCCYQVGPEVRAAFEDRTGRVTQAAWCARDGHLFLDLRGAIRSLLGAVGVGTTTMVGPCTACSPRFWSYRRDGAGSGRQLSFVGWA